MLRYQRMPDGLVHEIGLPAHRAMPDAYVTAFHLRDMLNDIGLEQLVAWSREPGLLPRVLAGPDRGRAWSILPDADLEVYSRDREQDIRFTAQTEMRRRTTAAPSSEAEPIQSTLL